VKEEVYGREPKDLSSYLLIGFDELFRTANANLVRNEATSLKSSKRKRIRIDYFLRRKTSNLE
jgi:hypothetical protein